MTDDDASHTIDLLRRISNQLTDLQGEVRANQRSTAESRGANVTVGGRSSTSWWGRDRGLVWRPSHGR